MTPAIRIERYSHGARISGYRRELFPKIAHFLESLKLKELEKVPPHMGGGFRTVIKKRYFGCFEDQTEVYIHRHHVDEFIGFIVDRGVDRDKIELVEIPYPDAAPAELTLYPHFVMRDYQGPIIRSLKDEQYSKRVDLQTGLGKAQSLDAKIKVPDGWKKMGDIQVGDTITAWDGKQTNVTGVFPQGRIPMYRITFADGRSTEVCGEHLWQSYYINTSHPQRWKVRTTKELLRLISMPNPRVYIPLPEAELGEDISLPMEPYTLGVLLGDGGFTTRSPIISTPDSFILKELEKYLPDTLSIKHSSAYDYRISAKQGNQVGCNIYTTVLRELELLGKRSWEKHIPKEYFNGSRQQRLSLLQGLLDTDGTVTKEGTGSSVSFSSSSYQLATGVQYLVRSLGGIASISLKEATYYTYKDEKKKGRISYQVNIRHKLPSELFRLPRKKKLTKDDGQYAAKLKLRVKSIVPIGNKEAQCISIDHPDRLYVTDDFIVTHNTLSALWACADMGERILIMIPPKYFGIWVKALRETYEDIENRHVTVSGSDELKAIMQKVADGDFPYDVVLISSTTYRAYIENFEKWGDKIGEMGYLVPPPRFHEFLQIGVQINDEYQEDPGLVFRIDIYTNVRKQIYLSATPYTGSDFVTRMIDQMVPHSMGVPLPDLSVYINVIALLYNDPKIQKTDYLAPFKGTYNHARYETRMLKQKRRLERYFGLVRRTVNGIYVHDRVEGQKLLILCATVEFIQHLTKYLKVQFPDLTIGMHVAGSDYKKLLTNDITVSTIKSSGTGVDIPNLREVLMLQATDSKKDNIQVLGRLRKMKDFPDVSPRFTYMVCTDIKKHISYHQNKQKYFDNRVKTHKMMKL